jgi:hypothetical protein
MTCRNGGAENHETVGVVVAMLFGPLVQAAAADA